jgi:transcription elongation factor SPT5
LDELSALQGKSGLAKGTGPGLVVVFTIEVIEGDLIGLQGKVVVSMDGDTTVKVHPNITGELSATPEVEFLIQQVRKWIPVGAHVMVIDGRYANETGVVVAVAPMEGDSNDLTAIVPTYVTN